MKKINKTMSDFFTACDGLSRSDEREFFDKYLDVKMPVLIRELTKVIQGGEFSDYCRDKAKQIYAKNNPHQKEVYNETSKRFINDNRVS